MANVNKNQKKIVIGSFVFLISLLAVLFLIMRGYGDKGRKIVSRRNMDGSKYIREENGFPPAADLPIPEIDDEYVGAILDVPVHPWQEERSKNISTETIKEAINNLANFDDMMLAQTSISGLIYADMSAAFQRLVVVRLARVRKLLDEGRADPKRVVSPLQFSFEEALAGWPKAAANRRRRWEALEKKGGAFNLSEPDQFSKYQVRSLAATYLLAELGDHQSLPLMLKCYKMHDDYLKSPPAVFAYAPVPPALTLYAMHRLISSFPEEQLNAEARQVRENYLQLAKCLPPPEKETVTKSWSANYDESDPRIRIFDPKGKVLQGEAKMEMAVYPYQFTDGTKISDVEGKVSERAELLFKELGRFVEAAYPGAKFP